VREASEHRKKYRSLWTTANQRGYTAIVPCDEQGDILKVAKRVVDGGLAGWVGFGASERAPEDFVVTTADRASASSMEALVRTIRTELGLPIILGKGFDLTNFLPIVRGSEAVALLQFPALLRTRVEESFSGAVSLTFGQKGPRPRPSPSEWLDELQEAYAEVRGFERFLFRGVYSISAE
jgi:hypothetical protein